MTFGPLQIALISWGYKTTAIFAKIAVPAVIGLLIILNIVMQSPHSYIDNYGIIHWDINYPFNILWFMSGILITLMPLIFLFTAKPKNQKASAKKTLFTITFLLGGLGGWSTVIFQSPILLAAAFSIFFLGFLSLAIMTILDITMKDDDSENTD
ncbi:MAG: hypothetical protein Q8P07_03145 [bacterium]|nr:hypothetical protein [bacterium]